MNKKGNKVNFKTQYYYVKRVLMESIPLQIIYSIR